MILGLHFKERIQAAGELGGVLVKEFLALIGGLQRWSEVEHDDEGHHTAITAQSIVVEDDADIGGDVGVEGSATIEGDAHVEGDLEVDGNLQGEGRLVLSAQEDESFATLGAKIGAGSPPGDVFAVRLTGVGSGGSAGGLLLGAGGVTGRTGLIITSDDGAQYLGHDTAGAPVTDGFYLPNGLKHVIPPLGAVLFWRGGATERHRIVGAESAVSVIAHSDANFNGDGTDANWVVDVSDQVSAWYRIDGDLMTLNLTVSASDVAGAPTELRFVLPAGYTVALRADGTGWGSDAGGALQQIRVLAVAGNAYVSALRIPAATWTNTTGDNTIVAFQVQIPITL